jgi:hypothetical protein
MRWQLCLSEISDDLAYGARCITAVEDICPITVSGQKTFSPACLPSKDIFASASPAG